MWECLCWANQELLFWERLQSRERGRSLWDWSHFEEQSPTEVSHGAFWRIKGKMKEETIQRRPTLPGDLFSHAHLCWEGITWPHAPVYPCVCLSVMEAMLMSLGESVCVRHSVLWDVTSAALRRLRHTHIRAPDVLVRSVYQVWKIRSVWLDFCFLITT